MSSVAKKLQKGSFIGNAIDKKLGKSNGFITRNFAVPGIAGAINRNEDANERLGMGSKAKAPETPDYMALQMQQQQADKEAFDYATNANRVNQSNPTGALTWTKDANGNWTQTETWDPAVTAAYNRQMTNQQAAQNGLNAQIEAANANGTWDPSKYGVSSAVQFDPNDAGINGDYADAYTKSLLARITPQQETDKANMETKLRLQGLVPGTEAYDRAYKNLLTSQGDVNTQAALQGQLAAGNEYRQNVSLASQVQQQQYDQALKNYSVPYEKAASLASLAGGVSAPSFAGYAGAAGQLKSADIAGAAQQQYAQQMQNYNQAQAEKSGKGATIGGAVGTIAGAYYGGPAGAQAGGAVGSSVGGYFSDIELKDDVKALDDEESFNRLIDVVPVSWKWKLLRNRDSGIIAQEIADRMPELVKLQQDGFLTVNYTGLFALLQGAFRHLAKELNHGA